MFLTTVLAVVLGLTSVAAHPTDEEVAVGSQFRCGAIPSPESISAAAEFSALERAESQRGDLSISAAGVTSPLSIETYFHVVAKDNTTDGGYVSDATLVEQLKVLNHDYAPHGINFVLGADVTRTINPLWATDIGVFTMRQNLRRGGYNALNVFFQYELEFDPNLLGKCFFPLNTTQGSNAFYFDGCAIKYTTLPGGSTPSFNMGKTLTHEVGHWFGLFHTFQGYSCTGPGDEIDDTPAQLSSTSGCPIGRDSCPNQPGLDPIHNYMDYSADLCYEEFTSGQRRRMFNMFSKFRA